MIQQYNAEFDRLLTEKERTPAYVARKIGVASSTVNRWLNGTTKPTIKHLPAIAKALGVSEKRIIDCFRN